MLTQEQIIESEKWLNQNCLVVKQLGKYKWWAIEPSQLANFATKAYAAGIAAGEAKERERAKPTTAAKLPCGETVSNVYEAYDAGRKEESRMAQKHIKQLREELDKALQAKPQQEPVAWMAIRAAVKEAISQCKDATGMRNQIDLYVNASQITHDAFDDASPLSQQDPVGYCSETAVQVLKAEKNEWMSMWSCKSKEHSVALYTSPPAREPMSDLEQELKTLRMLYNQSQQEVLRQGLIIKDALDKIHGAKPLKPLSDEEIEILWVEGRYYKDFARAIEAKLGVGK